MSRSDGSNPKKQPSKASRKAKADLAAKAATMRAASAAAAVSGGTVAGATVADTTVAGGTVAGGTAAGATFAGPNVAETAATGISASTGTATVDPKAAHATTGQPGTSTSWFSSMTSETPFKRSRLDRGYRWACDRRKVGFVF